MNQRIYIALARWCEDTWTIAAGPDEAKVIAFAEDFMTKNAPGTPNRIWVDDYIIESHISL